MTVGRPRAEGRLRADSSFGACSSRRTGVHFAGTCADLFGVDAEEAQHRGVAPLDPAGQRRQHLVEAGLRRLELVRGVVVPAIAPTEALALAEMDQDGAAQVD